MLFGDFISSTKRIKERSEKRHLYDKNCLKVSLVIFQWHQNNEPKENIKNPHRTNNTNFDYCPFFHLLLLVLFSAALSLCVPHRWLLSFIYFSSVQNIPLRNYFCHLSIGTWLDKIFHPQLFSCSFSFDHRLQVYLVVLFFFFFLFTFL